MTKFSKISTFKNLYNPNEPINVEVEKVLNSFKKDKYNVARISSIESKEERDEIKRTLRVVCFNGIFEKRSNDSLIEHSGLMTIDVDNINPLEYKEKFKAFDFVYACFISPSGRGIKALVRIPKVNSDAEYKAYYLAFQEDFPEIDPSGKDISRGCFVCYDPDIYINPDAVEYTKKKTNVDIKNDYATANRILNIIRYAQVGERHDKILKASILMGGYVPKHISLTEATRLLEQEAYNIDPSDFNTNKKAIADGLKNGMARPLKDFKELDKEELEYRHGKVYYTLYDLDDEIEKLYKEGVISGKKLSFENSKELISFRLGCTTYIYGAPYSGKSQVWFEMLINLSVNYGWRHAIFSPETGKAVDIFIELMTIYSRQDFYNDYNAQMNEDTKKEAKSFVDKYFIVLDPDDNVFSPEEFYDFIDIVERVYNTKIHTTTIDPFNELKHDWSKDNNRQDAYLERILGHIRRNARANERHNCVITHVTDQAPITQDGVTFYPPATYRQIAGGQSWSRKGEQMICVWRPPSGLLDSDGIPYEENETMVFVQKSKPKGVGKQGNFRWYYNQKKHCFFEKKYGAVSYPSRTIKSTKVEQKYIINENLNEWIDL